MGGLRSAKRKLNEKRVQIAREVARRKIELAKEFVKERAENDEQFAREILSVIGENLPTDIKEIAEKTVSGKKVEKKDLSEETTIV